MFRHVPAVAFAVLTLWLGPATAEDLPPWIPELPFGVAGYIGETEKGIFDTPTRVRSFLEFEELFGTSTAGLDNPYLAPSVAAFFQEGGGEAWIVRTVDASDGALVGVDGGVPGARTGLAALRDVDEVSAVVIPGATSTFVQSRMIAHCRTMGDRIAILDGVPGGEVNAIRTQRAALGAPEGFAALYTPWIDTFYLGQPVTLPPSGFLAGVFAKTTPNRSPVDVLGSAAGLVQEYSTQDVDILVPENINPIRSFPGQGIRVWGARTLAPLGDEMIYIAVRRLLFYLEESIEEGTVDALERPNDQTLWVELRARVENYLTVRWRDGWLQGPSPDDAFFVRCDLSTMSPLDLSEGRTILQVGVAAVRPAEFQIFEVVHQRSDATSAPAAAKPHARMLAPTPNPFNPRTRIAFELDRPSTVHLDVFDVTGRRVRTLLSASPLPAGLHRHTWNGTDGRGRPVASGVYSVRLRAGEVTAARRVTLVE